MMRGDPLPCVISSAARNFFRLRSRRNGRASENGKHGTPYALRSQRFIRAGKRERFTKKHPRLCLRGHYEKMLLTHSFLFRCVSQPPPLRGTSFHRKEGEPHPRTKAFPAWDRKRCENTVSPVPSFRAKARNLFRSRSRRNGRASENGKHGTPYAPRSRRFIWAGKFP